MLKGSVAGYLFTFVCARYARAATQEASRARHHALVMNEHNIDELSAACVYAASVLHADGDSTEISIELAQHEVSKGWSAAIVLEGCPDSLTTATGFAPSDAIEALCAELLGELEAKKSEVVRACEQLAKFSDGRVKKTEERLPGVELQPSRETPRFKHDACECCVFLGTVVVDKMSTPGNEARDIWCCMRTPVRGLQILGRWGDVDSEYGSFLLTDADGSFPWHAAAIALFERAKGKAS